MDDDFDGGDSVSDTSETGYGSRIIGSLVGAAAGVVIFLISFVVLFWGEGRAVRTAKDLEEGSAAVVSIADTSKVDSSADGKLVHMSGKAETNETLKDDEFGVSAQAIHLNRTVEIYQWKQEKTEKTEKKLGGKQVKKTTYSYRKVWSPVVIDSSTFFSKPGKPNTHHNYGTLDYINKSFDAKDVKLGAYALAEFQTKQMRTEEQINVTPEMLAALPPAMKGKFQIKDGQFYRSARAGQIGGGDMNPEEKTKDGVEKNKDEDKKDGDKSRDKDGDDKNNDGNKKPGDVDENKKMNPDDGMGKPQDEEKGSKPKNKRFKSQTGRSPIPRPPSPRIKRRTSLRPMPPAAAIRRKHR